MASGSGHFKLILDAVDAGVVNFVFKTYTTLADAMQTTIRLMFTLFFVTYGIAWMMRWIPGTIQDLLKNIIRMVFIFTYATNWDVFATTIYPIVTNAPDQIAGAMMGTTSENDVLGIIYDKAVYAAGILMFESDTWAFATKLGGLALSGVAFAMSIYAVGLLALSKIATAVLLGMSPLFVALMTFAATRGIFEGWFRQLLNYMFVALLTYGIIIFVILMNQTNADNLYTNATAGNLTTPDIYPFLFSGGVSIVLLAQVASIASGIAGGMQLSTLSPVGTATQNMWNNLNIRLGEKK